VKSEFKQAIERGLEFLNQSNLLVSYSGSSNIQWQPIKPVQTCFVPALILNCLADIPQTEALRSKLCQFLLKQRSTQWTFNYWSHDSPQNISLHYPDDLDDSACALMALYKHDPKIINQAALAKIVSWLLACEVKVGGPYKTWLSTTPGWDDVDVVVNANIAYFLSLVSNRLPELDKLIITSINCGSFVSAYYPSTWPIYYYLARICPVSHQSKLSRQIQHSLKTAIPNSLEVALALNALNHLPVDNKQLTSLQQKLLQTQQTDGSWPANVFCIDPSQNNQRFYNGSGALTTALALEALTGSQQLLKQKAKSVGHSSSTTVADKLQQRVTNGAREYFGKLHPELCQQANLALDKLLATDNNQQITLLPYKFAQSLVKPPPYSEDFYYHLGLANLYGWLAYTIYDDFLDEGGQPLQLPVANVALRQSVLEFLASLPDPVFHKQVLKVFDTMDAANSWEVARCRNVSHLPHYGKRSNLAERSLGHSLTLLAVLLASGQKINDPSVQDIMRAFRQYLITRQINDDAHDWQVDATNNHFSYVVVTILNGLEPTDLPIPSLIPQMQRQFWYKTLPQLCETMQKHLSQGHQAITDNPLLKKDNLVSRLLTDLQESTQETLFQQHQTVQFLAHYQQPNEVIKN
jgi:hypothetical protein